ncbi:MAG: hypothetical protein ACYDCL_18240, partial [Myxococcales bacterium]
NETAPVLSDLHHRLPRARHALAANPCVSEVVDRLVSGWQLGFPSTLDYLVAVVCPPVFNACRKALEHERAYAIPLGVERLDHALADFVDAFAYALRSRDAAEESAPEDDLAAIMTAFGLDPFPHITALGPRCSTRWVN